MSEYSDAVAKERSEMDQVESDGNRRMLKAYDDLISSLDTDLVGITAQIERSRANGEDVHPDWLRRQSRYARLMDQLESSRITFEQTGAAIIDDVHGTATERGAVHALERTGILFGDDPDIFSGQINMPAMENLIGQTGTTSPLMPILQSHGTGAADIITSGLIQGLSGQGADEIFRNIRRQLTSPTSDSRLMALVRTEMMNSYRASMHEQYTQFEDEIEGWMWSAHRGPRTCLACLAMDGQVFPMDQPFDQAHVCCRCSASPWPKDLYPDVRKFLQQEGSGEAWLRRQPRAKQAKMFPSKNSFEAFERGDLRLSDFVGYTDSPVWGRKIHAVSGRQAMKSAGVTPPPKASAKSAPKPVQFNGENQLGDMLEYIQSSSAGKRAGLSSEEVRAVEDLYGRPGQGINVKFRNGTAFDSDTRQSAERITSALNKGRLDDNVVMYRGGVSTQETRNWISPRSGVGDVFTDDGATFWAVRGDIADDYSNMWDGEDRYILKTTMPEGTNGLFVGDISSKFTISPGYKSDAGEFVTPPGTGVRIINKEVREDGTTVFTVEQIPAIAE